jgi:hypothetical protein
MLRSIKTLFVLMILVFPIVSDVKAQSTNACASPFCAFLPTIVAANPLIVRNVEVISLREYFIAVTGEVVNIGATSFYNVMIETELYDSENALRGEVRGSTFEHNVSPGTSNPFRHVYWIGPDGYTISRLESRIIDWSETP